MKRKLLLGLLAFICFFLINCNSFGRDAADFSEKLLPDTSWVEEKFPIYFIDGNKLGLINIDGTGLKYVFTANNPIREYIFSPDGKHTLVVTKQKLYQLDRESNHIEIIDYLGSVEGEWEKGLIHNIKWSPDSQRFLYCFVRWSSERHSKSHFYLYDRIAKEKKLVEASFAAAASSWWDMDGKNFYYSEYEIKKAPSPYYKVKIFRISLATLNSELVKEFESNDYSLKFLNLEPLKINLFTTQDDLEFAAASNRTFDLSSDRDVKLGLDKNDYLYYEDSEGNRKDLNIKIPRNFQGVFLVSNLRWIPDSKYVIIDYWPTSSIFILEPVTGRMGKLINGRASGWYQK